MHLLPSHATDTLNQLMSIMCRTDKLDPRRSKTGTRHCQHAVHASVSHTVTTSKHVVPQLTQSIMLASSHHTESSQILLQACVPGDSKSIRSPLCVHVKGAGKGQVEGREKITGGGVRWPMRSTSWMRSAAASGVSSRCRSSTLATASAAAWSSASLLGCSAGSGDAACGREKNTSAW